MKKENSQALTKELYIFTTLGLIAGTIFGLYYGIFLYRNSLDIKVLVIDTLLVSISGWMGYIIGVFYIHKSGYLKTLKLSFLLLFLSCLLTLYLIRSIRTTYPLISIARGVPLGIGLAVFDTFLLKEFISKSRGKFFSINLSIEFATAVLVPFALGAVILYAGGYKTTFLLAALVYLAAFFVPVRYNKRPHSDTKLSDELKLLKQKGIKEFNINTVMTSGMDELNVLLFAIVPFLLLGNEVKVGSLISLVAIVAGLTAFLSRNFRYKRQIKLGYVGNIGRLLSNTLLSVSWTPFAVVVQTLANKSLAAFNDPIFRKLRLNAAEEALGAELNKEALEFNLISATMTLLGQVMALGVFLLILSLPNENQITALRYLLTIYGFWKLINYIWVINMRRRFRLMGKETARPVTVQAQ